LIQSHYQEELRNLRESAVDFARAHPALAPMLGEASADPDVERLLEGVAFLTGLVRGKLDDDFPEIVQGLTHLIFPHLLRPVPSATIMAFEPRPSLAASFTVPAGTEVASIPVDGTHCTFRTCRPVEVHPLALVGAGLQSGPGQPDRIRLEFQLKGLSLSAWKPGELVLYLGDGYAEATALHLLLTRYLERIVVAPRDGGSPWVLPGRALAALGFEHEDPLARLPGHVFQGFRLVQDYFDLPQNFLFLALDGWDRWRDRGPGSSFDLLLELRPAPVPVPRIQPQSFILYATPAVNLFPCQAEPAVLDHKAERLRVLPAGFPPGHARVFSVDRVTGHAQGSMARREYAPVNLFARHRETRAVYQARRSRSPLDGSAETHLSFAYPPDSPGPAVETLVVDLTCTNGSLPERLQAGEISRPTESSPQLATFRNLTAPTASAEPPLGDNHLWRLLSHLNLNLTGLAQPGHLQELLRLYGAESQGRPTDAAHRKRLEGILEFAVAPSDLLVRGRALRGQDARLTARADCFAGLGDLHLFAAVLERFLALLCSFNCYSRLTLMEPTLGETFPWPARLGDRPIT
jgi:type VI secretion system protein ImpG